jgi:mRNA interferase MazF
MVLNGNGEINQFEVFLIELDPTKGHEIQKTRPCVEVQFGGKQGWIVLDQVRTVDRLRLLKKLGKIDRPQIVRVKAVLKEMFVDW